MNTTKRIGWTEGGAKGLAKIYMESQPVTRGSFRGLYTHISGVREEPSGGESESPREENAKKEKFRRFEALVRRWFVVGSIVSLRAPQSTTIP